MAIKLSKYFGVPAAELRKRGVLNAYLGIDNKLFLDPNLLKGTRIGEFKNARTDLETYFVPVIKLLKVSKSVGDAAWLAARKRLLFKEEHGTSLGYANAGESGRAIGPLMASILAKLGKEIVDLGIDATEMFELIGLFQEGFGPDLLSDMAVAILRERFLKFTQRVTLELNLQPQKQFQLNNKPWILPVYPSSKRPLVFVPSDLLTPLPVALDRSEISDVADFNEEVRKRWNEIVTKASRMKRDVTKKEIREMLFANPNNLAGLIEVYRKAAGNKYDFETDPLGFVRWESIGQAAAEKNPITIQIKQPKNPAELRTVVGQIVSQFKKNIEENKLYEVLYNEDGSPQRERYAQRIFFAIADAYCSANNVDLSREPDAGSGPVDFKLSTGYKGRFLVELKKSDNSSLLRGFEAQLPAYEKSESTQESLYLILRVSEGETAIKDVLALREKWLKENRKVPDVIVIDARKQKSASKR